MAKAKKEPPIVGNAEIPIRKLEDNSFPSFHHEYFNDMTPIGKVRFLQHINGAVFWLQVSDKQDSNKWTMYSMRTEDLLNAAMAVIAPLHAQQAALIAKEKGGEDVATAPGDVC